METEEEKKLEAYLQNEATQLQRDQEVERVLGCFKMDPFAILQLSYQFTDKEVKLAYRRKSLLIHPDKASIHKAETELNDEKRRTWLLQLVSEAQHSVHTAMNKGAVDETSAAFKEAVRNKFKDLLIEEELRRRRLLKKEMERESNEMRKVDEDIETRKRKKQADKAWEDSRDTRVGNWRDFMAGGKGKKSNKKPEDANKPYIKRPAGL
ncbi:hypothetical protein BDF19DRAFT_471746 [Syncephalis fuscata]|nr:hypothetical protein BDF19DRAFT_471746 [Syncephalis fuscata]